MKCVISAGSVRSLVECCDLAATCNSALDPRAHLGFDDIAINNPENPAVMQVYIKASKTDPFS